MDDITQFCLFTAILFLVASALSGGPIIKVKEPPRRQYAELVVYTTDDLLSGCKDYSKTKRNKKKKRS